MKIRQSVLNWLLEEDQPVVRYRSLVDLLDVPLGDSLARAAALEIPRRGWARKILDSQRPDGYWVSSRSLYRPKYNGTNWRMLVLSDFGLTSSEPGVRRACDLFFDKWLVDEEEFYRDGEVCIVGNLARMLTRCGYADDPRVKHLFDWLVQNQKDDGGWHCFKSDSGTLDCWEPLAAYASLPRSKLTRGMKSSKERGAEFYLERRLKDEGRRYEPWFRFHYPNHYYYDILVGLNTLGALGYGKEEGLRPALQIVAKKMLANGTWSLDAVHPDIGAGANYTLRRPAQPLLIETPGRPSKWITLTCLRAIKAAEI